MKKLLSLLTTAALILGLFVFPASAEAADAPTSGTCGDLSWSFNSEENTLSFSGEGKLADLSSSADYPWSSFSVTKIEIGAGVRELNPLGLYSCKYINEYVIENGNEYFSTEGCNLYSKDGKVLYRTSSSIDAGATIKDGVEVIGKYACANLNNKLNCVLPQSVREIEYGAFSAMRDMRYINIPPLVTKIPDCCFYNCKYLKTVTFNGNGIKEIGNSAFYNCSALNGFKLPETLEKLSAGAFYGAAFTDTIEIPEGITEIPYRCFYKAYPKTNTVKFLGNNVKTIGAEAFAETQLRYIISGDSDSQLVTLPEGLERIGSSAFYKSWVGRLVLPDTLKVIENNAFAESGVYEAKVPDTIEEIGSDIIIDTTYAEKNTVDNLIYFGNYLVGKEKNLRDFNPVVMEGTVGICNGAMSGLGYVTTVTLPASLERIGEGALPMASSNFSEIILSENNKHFILDNGVLLNAEKTRLYACPPLSGITEYAVPGSVKRIDNCAFQFCGTLEKIALPDSIEYLGSAVFNYCGALKKATVPEGIEELKTQLFHACSNLNELKLPSTLKTIGYLALKYAGIRELDLPEGLEEIKTQAFEKCVNLKSITIPDNVSTLGSSAFYGCAALEEAKVGKGISYLNSSVFTNCTSLKSVEFNAELTGIGNSGFNSCFKLETVDGIDNITSVGEKAFQNCGSLKNFTISKKLKNIPYRAFYGVSNLTLDFRDSNLKTIGEEAFGNCRGLDIISLGDKLTSIGASAFASSDITRITIPDSVTKIGDAILKNCASLEEVEFNNIYKQIPPHCCEGCARLGTVVIPENVTYINNHAFAGCSELKDVFVLGTACNVDRFDSFLNCKKLANIYIAAFRDDAKNDWKTLESKLNGVDFHYGYNQVVPTEDISGAEVSGVENAVYTGKAITRKLRVHLGEAILSEGADYTVTYKNNKNVGTADIIITGVEKYSGMIIKSFKITKADNPIKLSVKAKAVSFKKLKKAKATVSPITVKSAAGKLSFKKAAGSSKLTVNSKGIVSVKKGSKKGTYTAKVKITAKGNSCYKSFTKTVIVKIKVK